jgi:hypothetical protein
MARLLIVVVAIVLVPNTFNVLVAVILPATKLDPVALSKNSVERKDDKALSVIAYKLEEVALVFVILVILL